jgi:hypothetical protein
VQSARQAAGYFASQFPSNNGDMARIHASIEDEEKQRKMLKEKAEAHRALRREQTGSALRQARADRRRQGETCKVSKSECSVEKILCRVRFLGSGRRGLEDRVGVQEHTMISMRQAGTCQRCEG